MSPDDMYPNSGEYFSPTEPLEQKNERTKEKAHVLEALPVIKAIIKRFDERIAFYSSIDSIEVDLSSKPELHQKLVAVAQLAKQMFIAEKEELESLLADYAKK